jgi:uncharacterized protein YjbJ (UPF0337 family)
MFKLTQYVTQYGQDIGRRVRRFFIYAVCLAMVSMTVWGTALTPSAVAAGVGSQSAADVVNSRAAAELDRVSGEGTSDKLEGAAQETAGKVKRGISRVGDDVNGATNQLDGSADQLEGKVKRDVGRAKGAAADAGEDIKEGADGVVESIKSFFNK